MAENITLQIYTPEKTVLNKKVYRVVLPYGKINLTLIDDRAPTSLVLHPGLLEILAEDDRVVEAYFIDGGVVDAADNVCKISTRNIIKQSKITLEQALELKKQKPHDAIFYQMIADYLQNFS